MHIDNKLIVGSEEWCSFSSLAIPAIKARVDSGAKTSSLHAFSIHSFNRDGEEWVSFEVHPIQHDRKTTVRCESRIVDRRYIKSSNGTREKRYVIVAPLQIGGHTWEIELTLTNRDSMGYRMLLGREAMQGRMLVDPAASFCLDEMSEHEINTLYNIHSSTAKGLKIGVLASNPDLYSNRRLMEVGAERGHEMVFLNIRQCYLRMDTDSPEVFYRGGRVLNDLDVIIPRIRSDLTFYGCALVRHFESLGVFVLNASAAISQCRDALFSLQVLQQNGLDLPVSGFANMPIDTNELIDLVGGAPLIVKALNTGQGLLQEQLVAATVLAHTREEAQNVINAIKVEGGSVNLLVQAFVAEADGKDLRCLVLDGKVVAAIQRTAVEGKLDTRVENGGKASAIQITPEEQRLAIKAARTLGLKIAGVDIIRSNKGPLLLKVNASPGLEGIESVTKKDVASAIIDTVEKKLQRLKKSAKL